MTMIVRNTGSTLENSLKSMWRIWTTMRAPTITSAAAATSSGTTWVRGVKNIARRNSTPVTTLAKPVFAPSPMPEADSTKTVFDEAETPPPTTAPTPSTISADCRRGNVPSSAARPALRARPVIEPMASKKLVKTSVKMSITAASAPMRPKEPKRSNWPTSDRFGSDTSEVGSCGTVRFQPAGFLPSDGPMWKIASSTMATIVATTMPISRAPFTLRAIRTPMTTSAIRKTRVGTVAMEPASPSWTGGDERLVLRTKPLSTNPMKAMKSPMPTVIAVLSCAGTALKISRRSPVAASSTMMIPLITTSPIASCQVTM